MINILSSHSIYGRQDVIPVLKKYIKEDSKICVIAFSFFNVAFRQDLYEASYTAPEGRWYLHILTPLLNYGIKEENVNWIIYDKDTIESAKAKIETADIIFLPGGAPDLFVERLKKYDLLEYLKNLTNKIFMGPSAGTMIQFNWFHISPDYDYKKFMLSEGLDLIRDFGVEVHYRRRRKQKKGIRRVSHLDERPIYTIHEDGLMILENNKIIYQKNAVKYYEKGRKIRY